MKPKKPKKNEDTGEGELADNSVKEQKDKKPKKHDKSDKCLHSHSWKHSGCEDNEELDDDERNESEGKYEDWND